MDYILSFSLINSFILFLIIYNLKHISITLKLIDKPSQSKIKIHSEPMPNIGGLILILFLSNYFFYEILFNNKKFLDVINLSNENTIIYLFTLFFFIIGLLDDYINISAKRRLLIISVIVLIFLYINNNILITEFYSSYFENKIKINIFYIQILFTVFCILFLQNCLNMYDGINGSLLSAIIPLLIVLLYLNFSIILFLTFIITILLLLLNVNNKLFIGNNGSFAYSGLLSLYLIFYHTNNPINLSAEKIILLLFFPTIDVLRLFIFRIFNGYSPFKGDLNHFHHLVLKKFSYIFWIPTFIIYTLFIYYLSLFMNNIFLILINTCVYFILIFYFKNRNYVN